jgi:hypothetical protein
VTGRPRSARPLTPRSSRRSGSRRSTASARRHAEFSLTVTAPKDLALLLRLGRNSKVSHEPVSLTAVTNGALKPGFAIDIIDQSTGTVTKSCTSRPHMPGDRRETGAGAHSYRRPSKHQPGLARSVVHAAECHLDAVDHYVAGLGNLDRQRSAGPAHANEKRRSSRLRHRHHHRSIGDFPPGGIRAAYDGATTHTWPTPATRDQRTPDPAHGPLAILPIGGGEPTVRFSSLLRRRRPVGC